MSNKKTTDVPERDELAQLIVDTLNKLNKSGEKDGFFLDGYDQAPTEFTEFISTGATMLDLAISNRPDGGIAVGRITEVTGLEGSGKSLVCAHILADTIKRGGVGVLFDTENAMNREFLNAIGVDLSQLAYFQRETIEDIFEGITQIIEMVRKKDKNKLVTIVVDSVAAATTKKEIEADYGKDGYATDKAIIISKAMRKITNMLGRERIAVVFTNQLRQKLNATPFGEQWTTSGGKAIAFHASTRIRLTQLNKLKNPNKDVIGVKVKANVVKNRLGPPHREAEFDIYFDRGIDDYSSWLKVLKDNKLIKQAGAWYLYVDKETGEEIKFQSKDFPEFLESNAERKRKLYTDVCDAIIMRYRTEFDPDSIIVAEAGDDE